ncbi:hypothetical protein PHISP_00658 [Aspergillus sp. HF37]|nr:hypothetical protein PHISP_00658 [Aspergillus sp. HF37]
MHHLRNRIANLFRRPTEDDDQMGQVRGRVRPGSKIWGPEPPMPWSLGLPVFDKDKGKYVAREPVKEPKKPDPNIHDKGMVWSPLHRGYDAYMRKKEGDLKKRVQRAKKISMEKKAAKRTRAPDSKASVDNEAGKKKKKYFWEKPKPRRRRKILSIRGERV